MIGSKKPVAPERGERISTASDYTSSDLEALLVLRRYRDWILGEFAPYLRGNAVEIGAGIGSYSREILRSVASLDLVEPSVTGASHLANAFAAEARVTLVPSTAEHWVAAAGTDSYDSAVMINVLEHIDDDRQMLGELRRVIRPSGHLLLFVPALMQLYSPLDQLLGHHRRYHLPDLREKVEAAGFVIQIARYFDILGTLPWLVVNRILGATSFSSGLAALYDGIGVPLTSTFERIVSPPFGKNILLIAQPAGLKAGNLS